MNIVKKSKLDIDPYCKLHNKKVEIYYEKDQKLLCSECIIHSHQHHKMRTVTEVLIVTYSKLKKKDLFYTKIF